MSVIRKNQKGSSLVEVILAAGLAGGLALVVAKIAQDSIRIGKTAETNMEINGIVSNISQILSDGESCSTTVGMNREIGAQITHIKRVRNLQPEIVYGLAPIKY